MTTDLRVSESSDAAAVVRGRPFLPGQSGNPAGRARKKQTIRDILTAVPLEQKRALVKVAYSAALDGDVHWAEWIVKHSGEGALPGGDTFIADKMILVRYVTGEEAG